MKSIVFFFPIRKLAYAILVGVHFMKKRGITMMINKANIYSEVLK